MTGKPQFSESIFATKITFLVGFWYKKRFNSIIID